MYTCCFVQTLEDDALMLDALPLGDVPRGLGTPSQYCLVEENGEPVMRIDVYGDTGGFADIQIWHNWLVIGFADMVHFVSLETRQYSSHALCGYFGHLYPLQGALLVASASDLLCFDAQARLQWITEDLGIDGVVISRVAGNIIYGEGEWDPPGGWRPFQLALHTGHIVAEQ
ncbi:hypothetical protein KDA_30700 [Dictyobacter alpinus]|uniref:Uncharacterized protein n=1 Tax=Dictyobacter alpinus TaxID=2014873 RepID=A0A402B8C2_9CHLR|nr:hypothetical protein [Dictyobacter alpinus]GCE27586.1 hypothetical protein KDA_30700 [Dictyobacter alpinus]